MPCFNYYIVIPRQHRDYRTITALSLRLHPRESGQLSISPIIPQNHGITTRKLVPITGQASSSLEFVFVFENSNLNQIKYCSSFLLCLQGQPELCGRYHLLQSCFSFFPSHIFNFCIYFKCFFLYLYIYLYISQYVRVPFLPFNL